MRRNASGCFLEPWEVAALVDVTQRRRRDRLVYVFGRLVTDRILMTLDDQDRSIELGESWPRDRSPSPYLQTAGR